MTTIAQLDHPLVPQFLDSHEQRQEEHDCDLYTTRVDGFEGKLEWSGENDGALRRTADTSKLVKLFGKEPAWTPLREAIDQTLKFYLRTLK